jgi:hypothetical protein
MNWLGRCSDLVSGRAKNSHGEGSNEGSCVMQTNNQPVILWGQVQLRWNFFHQSSVGCTEKSVCWFPSSHAIFVHLIF